MSLTLQSRIAAALIHLGHTELPTKSRRYRTFTTRHQSKSGKPHFYFIGKAGALRRGTSPTNSIPCSDLFKSTLLNPTPAAKGI